MLKALSAQVNRLFSSKTNGGYAQFRDHFQCQGNNNIDKKHLTTWCWVNGTTTLSFKGEPQQSDAQRYIPHVGIQFAPAPHDKFETISHNYMRSLWALLLLMVICSFMAQRRWASIFNHDILRALLKLPGHEELPLVKRAQELNAYEKLQELAKQTTSQQQLKLNTQLGRGSIGNGDGQAATGSDKRLGHLESLFHSIEIITGDENAHNHLLDYYPNQLIYLLMAKRASAYKLSGLKLRRKLISHSICSFLLTVSQFLLPLFFIGPDYLNFGFNYAKAWLRFTLKQILNPNYNVNSIDYELSGRIFPTSTSCEYKEFGYQGVERIIVQCTVPINEICSKLFVIIWWFTIINIIIELYSLLWVLICGLNFATIKWSFGRKLSKRTRREAEMIATFRYQHAMLLHKLLKSAEGIKAANLSQQNSEAKQKLDPPEFGGETKGGAQIPVRDEDNKTSTTTDELSERDRKQLEAEGERGKGSSHVSLEAKKWYLWCSRDVCMFLANRSKKLEPGKLIKGKNHKSPEDENGFKELREDLNIYYLMQLLYFRLNCSRKKIEQIIRMTSDALSGYLENLKRVEDDIGVLIPEIKVVGGGSSNISPDRALNYESDIV